MNNNSSIENSTLFELLECLVPQNFNSSSEFFKCYALLYRNNWVKATCGILLATLAFVLNVLVILLLVKKPFKKNIFDQILIAHCIVDGVTGLIDVPFFHINDLFGYWPLGDLAAHFWSSYDNSINVITNLHMLYMTWIRFRSIRAPNSYEKELIARKPKIVCLCFWLIGLGIWIPVTTSYGLSDYSTNVNYNNMIVVELLLIVITWFIPLTLIILFSVLILLYLNKRKRTKGKLQVDLKHSLSMLSLRSQHTNTGIETTTTTTRRRSTAHIILYRIRKLTRWLHLGPQARFQIIIISYCLQWFPSCLLGIIDAICNCIPGNVTGGVYWLTYTVCFTDPLVILIFNPNVSIHRAKVTPH